MRARAVSWGPKLRGEKTATLKEQGSNREISNWRGVYGAPGITGTEFREVKLAQHHRGGLLGMGAILTKTSRPNRTSPVVRGDYLYQVVLGFSSPPPPPIAKTGSMCGT